MVSTVVELLIMQEEKFIHPGISVDPWRLEETREELVQGNAPWMGFYEAMLQSRYAQEEFSSANLKRGTVDIPNYNAFNGAGVNNYMSSDGFRAFTQILLYYLTGKSVYRYNALRLVRIWKNMDPNQYEYYTDSHIHVGTPFFYMVSAAELIEYTSVTADTYDDIENGILGYSLFWTEEDTEKFIGNFVDPVISTFLYNNTYYLNQHLYPTTGALAGYIFKNDRPRYEEAVEWLMVNKTTARPDVNGALKHQFLFIDAEQKGNPVHEDYIQHLEMGRDNAHSSADVLMFTAIARILTQQKTKVDPREGTVSEEEDARSVYEFLNNRLLHGAEKLYRYMGGYTIPWTQLGYQDYGGRISEAYRGRTGLYYNMSELYDAYRYKVGMSREELQETAPGISRMAQNLTSPLFYNGQAQVNFWGSFSDTKLTELGCEYWLSLPRERNLDEGITIPMEMPGNADILLYQRAAVLDAENAVLMTEARKYYVRIQAVKNREVLKETDYDNDYPEDTVTVRGGAQIAVPSLIKPAAGYLALRVRAEGSAVIQVSSNNRYGTPYQEFVVPCTGGEWKNVAYSTDIEQQIHIAAQQLDNMEFYTLLSTGSAVVDAECLLYINGTGGLPAEIPALNAANGQTYYLLSHVLFEYNFRPAEAEDVSYRLQGEPEGMLITAEGVISWFPRLEEGPLRVIITAENEALLSARQVYFQVYAGMQQAYDAVMELYNEAEIYTISTYHAFLEKKSIAEGLFNDGSIKEEFVKAINELSDSISRLELLNPVLEDGTFNYLAYRSIISDAVPMSRENIKNLLDNDAGTFSGDLRAPLVFDFGMDYRITAEAYSLQARTGFPDRYAGASVYGSNDYRTWMKLTAEETSETELFETLPVLGEQKNERYRFIRLDPHFPDEVYETIFSISEFRIHGIRHEVDNKIRTVSISGSGIKDLVVEGDMVTISFETDDEITDIHVYIADAEAEIIQTSAYSWEASLVLGTVQGYGEIAFRIDYSNSKGEAGPTVYRTTDGSALYLSDHTYVVRDMKDRIGSSSSAADAALWFDSDLTTSAEFRQNEDGDTYVIFDFSDDPIYVMRVEYLARQDQYASRAASFTMHGSVDGISWEQLIDFGRNTQDWQLFDSRDKLTGFTMLRMYCRANYLGLTELRVISAGERSELINKISAVSIYGDGVKNRVTAGNMVTLAFTAEENIVDVQVIMDGAAAEAKTDDGITWYAKRVIPDEYQSGDVEFQMTYKDAAGNAGKKMTETTDGSVVYRSNERNIVADIETWLWGSSSGSYLDAAVWFDSNIETMAEFRPGEDRTTYLSFNFADRPLNFGRVEFLARQDQYASRASTYLVQGSADGVNWTDITGRGTDSKDWQVLYSKDTAASFSYIRMYCWANYLGLVELRVFSADK